MRENPYIFKVQKYAIHDGPGIRTTLFFQGCPLSCRWCHNPESQAIPPKMEPEEIETVAAGLMAEIEKDLIFYTESGGGVTFSGGEPLSQPELLFALLDLCREKEIHTCLDTSGYGDEKILLRAAKSADLILYDLKLMDEALHIRHTGRGNRLVLNNLKQVSKNKIPLRLRFPLIPGMTDTPENINGIVDFITQSTRYRDIHILPFHKAGEAKYAVLNRENFLLDTRQPSQKEVDSVKDQFESGGFNVTIGG